MGYSVYFLVYYRLLGPVSMVMFNWDGAEATMYNGLAMLAFAFVSLFTCLLIGWLSKRQVYDVM